MERQLALERRSQWQYSRAADDTWNKKLCKAVSWPWGTFTRAWDRLQSATIGKEIDEKSEGVVCDAECLECGLRLPCYGLQIAQLQRGVRYFYGIDGSFAKDCFDGCCCPCPTLVRNENEIILREKQSRPHAEPGTFVTTPYRSHSPMMYSIPSRMQAASSSAPTSVGSSQPGKGKTTTAGRTTLANCDDQGVSVLIQNDQVDAVPMLVQVHSLSKDQVAALSNTPTIHELNEDATTPAKGVSGRKHSLKTDKPFNSSRGSSSHALKDDVKVSSAEDRAAHGLKDDNKVDAAGDQPAHGLKDDAKMNFGSNSQAAHVLKDDIKVASTLDSMAAHGLKEDAKVGVGGNSAHALTDDVKLDSGGKDGKHDLAKDETALKVSRGTLHELGG